MSYLSRGHKSRKIQGNWGPPVNIDWMKEVLSVIAQHGPWAVLSFYCVYNLIKLQRTTIEVLTAVRTLIENLECRSGPQ